MLKKIRNTVRGIRDAWRAYREVKQAINNIKKGGDMPTAVANGVPVKPASKSVINWTVIISVLASILNIFGIDVPEEVKLNIQVGITSFAGLIIWIRRTFFNNTVTKAVV